jgi:hypothetical protein
MVKCYHPFAGLFETTPATHLQGLRDPQVGRDPTHLWVATTHRLEIADLDQSSFSPPASTVVCENINKYYIMTTESYNQQ